MSDTAKRDKRANRRLSRLSVFRVGAHVLRLPDVGPGWPNSTRNLNVADRAVRKTRKDRDGDILALCNNGDYWSPRAKHDVIDDIEQGLHTYYVPWTSGRTEIRVVQGSRGNT